MFSFRENPRPQGGTTCIRNADTAYTHGNGIPGWRNRFTIRTTACNNDH